MKFFGRKEKEEEKPKGYEYTFTTFFASDRGCLVNNTYLAWNPRHAFKGLTEPINVYLGNDRFLNFRLDVNVRYEGLKFPVNFYYSPHEKNVKQEKGLYRFIVAPADMQVYREDIFKDMMNKKNSTIYLSSLQITDMFFEQNKFYLPFPSEEHVLEYYQAILGY